MRLILSLILLLTSVSVFSQTTETVNGNTFTFSSAETATVMDPIAGKSYDEVFPPRPLTMNGEVIYNASNLMTLPGYKKESGKELKLSELLFDAVKDELQTLDDGEYILDIDNAVISKEGKLVYYKYKGVWQLVARRVAANTDAKEKMTGFVRVTMDPEDQNIPVTIKNTINSKITNLLEHLPACTPGTISKKPVNITGELFNNGSVIVVKNHKPVFVPAYFAL
ncbi:MAG: hypothetical protein JWQ38_3699 [Flavipsychrobacter sp.]|nr:hypothetical protein [Flavipsychrobacter sp.]